jgi:hypothetical protein
MLSGSARCNKTRQSIQWESGPPALTRRRLEPTVPTQLDVKPERVWEERLGPTCWNTFSWYWLLSTRRPGSLTPQDGLTAHRRREGWADLCRVGAGSAAASGPSGHATGPNGSERPEVHSTSPRLPGDERFRSSVLVLQHDRLVLEGNSIRRDDREPGARCTTEVSRSGPIPTSPSMCPQRRPDTQSFSGRQ